MSVDEIVKKIVGDAEKKAAEIKSETDKQLKSLLEEAKKEAEQRQAEMVETARESIADRKERAEAMAQLETRKDLLARKRKHMESVFAEAKNRLNDLPEDKYAELIKKQLSLSCFFSRSRMTERAIFREKRSSPYSLNTRKRSASE